MQTAALPDAGPVSDAEAASSDETGGVLLVVNPGSGRNARDRAAIDAVQEALGATLCPFRSPEQLSETLRRARPAMVVSAGGDGTAMATASALIGTGIPLGVLPMGTFNYFVRGLGFDEDPLTAARQILAGHAVEQRVATVNGQVFLNNASLGIYPAILKERETVYARWGRRRLMAHWSVVRSFLRFRKPMRVTLDMGEVQETRRTPLVFVGRSAFQLERFGLAGGDAIEQGGFAVLVVRGETRRDLFRMSARLATRVAAEGEDYDLYRCDRLTIERPKGRRSLVAFDGEKRMMAGPLRFEMSEAPLTLMLPGDPEA